MTANEVLGKENRVKTISFFDVECEEITDKNMAVEKMIKRGRKR
jgi:hypothetical protein